MLIRVEVKEQLQCTAVLVEMLTKISILIGHLHKEIMLRTDVS